jgi:hypothetical protein
VLGVYTGTQDGALVFIKDTICSFAAGAISGLIVFKFGTLEIASAFGAAIMMIFVYTLLYKEDKKMVLLGKANK